MCIISTYTLYTEIHTVHAPPDNTISVFPSVTKRCDKKTKRLNTGCD